MNRVLVLILLLTAMVWINGAQAPVGAQGGDFPTTQAEIMALKPQIAIEGEVGEVPELYPDLDDLADEGSMMTLVEWPTLCVSNGVAEQEQTVLLAVSCGEEQTYSAQFLGACSANHNDPLGTMAAASTEPGRLPVEEFACFPIPPD